MAKDIFRLFLKLFLLGIPLWLLLAAYFVFDPFKVLYTYTQYNFDYALEIPLNRDYISTENLLKHNETYRYDSFIFGSSKALSFLCSDWKNFISGSCFHYDASGESLFGILGKLRFLEREKIPIKNCLIILDSATLAGTQNSKGHLYIKHPLVSRESPLRFQYEFLTTFLSNKFFPVYLLSKLNIKMPKYFGYQGIADIRSFVFDQISNDVVFSYAEEEFKADTKGFYERNRDKFYERSNNRYIIQPVIGDEQFNLLREIKNIFSANNANYRLIIFPAYDQKEISPEDIRNLNNIFGADNVFNYSGINTITRDAENYYEADHCRAKVGKEIMGKIYARQ